MDLSHKDEVKCFALLVIFYFLSKFPDLLVLRSFTSSIFPLNALYIADNILFPAGGLNPELESTVIAPSNASLIYPPGIFMLVRLLGSVENIYIFSFVAQLLVPLFSFYLFRSVSSVFVSLVMTIFSIHYFTNAIWAAPDFIIQPIMLLALLPFLIGDKSDQMVSKMRIVVVGLLTGIIITLKHNVGLTFGILLETLIFVRSFTFKEGEHGPNRILLFSLVACFFGFGVVFLSRILYLDEVVYYLVPFFGFWIFITCWCVNNKSIGLNKRYLISTAVIYGASSLLLPGLVFLWFGGVIGYSRYWYSLFGMGFQYLPIWDYGMVGIIQAYARFTSLSTLRNVYLNYNSLLYFFMFVLPFAANCLVVGILFKRIHGPATPTSRLVKDVEVGALGIMGVFMLFPLEGLHILATKLFLYCFVFLYVSQYFHRAVAVGFKYACVCVVVPVVLFVIGKPVAVYGIERTNGSVLVQRVVGLPLAKRVDEELEKQLAVVKRAVNENPYYVVDSSGMSLTTMMAFVNNHRPQYYLEMRKGILSEETTIAILAALSSRRFVLVNSADYRRFLENRLDDPFLARILKVVHANYQVVDRYDAPSDPDPSVAQMHSFLIVKKSSN